MLFKDFFCLLTPQNYRWKDPFPEPGPDPDPYKQLRIRVQEAQKWRILRIRNNAFLEYEHVHGRKERMTGLAIEFMCGTVYLYVTSHLRVKINWEENVMTSSGIRNTLLKPPLDWITICCSLPVPLSLNQTRLVRSKSKEIFTFSQNEQIQIWTIL